MQSVSVRYIVDDVEAALTFYRDQLGFELELHPAPGFAMLSRGSLVERPGRGRSWPSRRRERNS